MNIRAMETTPPTYEVTLTYEEIMFLWHRINIPEFKFRDAYLVDKIDTSYGKEYIIPYDKLSIRRSSGFALDVFNKIDEALREQDAYKGQIS